MKKNLTLLCATLLCVGLLSACQTKTNPKTEAYELLQDSAANTPANYTYTNEITATVALGEETSTLQHQAEVQINVTKTNETSPQIAVHSTQQDLTGTFIEEVFYKNGVLYQNKNGVKSAISADYAMVLRDPAITPRLAFEEAEMSNVEQHIDKEHSHTYVFTLTPEAANNYMQQALGSMLDNYQLELEPDSKHPLTYTVVMDTTSEGRAELVSQQVEVQATVRAGAQSGNIHITQQISAPTETTQPIVFPDTLNDYQQFN